MIKIKEAVIVEGKYDKIRLQNIIDGLIIPTNGFSIFNDKEKQFLIRKLAEERGLLILTDSDAAGFMIRNFLKGCVPYEKIKHAYIPDIFGKEKRKSHPSKEGKLGVEGITEAVLLDAILCSGAECTSFVSAAKNKCEEITKSDFYSYGLSGTPCASENRERLKRYLHFPEHMSANTLLQTINFLMTKSEFEEKLHLCFDTKKDGTNSESPLAPLDCK